MLKKLSSVLEPGSDGKENGVSVLMLSDIHSVCEPEMSIMPRSVGKSTAESS